MKTITLNIPDDQRIGEAIYEAIKMTFVSGEEITKEGIAITLRSIEDQDLLSLLAKTNER